MFPGETILSGATTDGVSDFQVMSTPAGYYIGTSEMGMPYSRESGYYQTPEQAQATLADWLAQVSTMLGSPAEFIGGPTTIRAARKCWQHGLLKDARS
jgi:hypothetical protein